jgi:hypothetical protein
VVLRPHRSLLLFDTALFSQKISIIIIILVVLKDQRYTDLNRLGAILGYHPPSSQCSGTDMVCSCRKTPIHCLVNIVIYD